MPYLASGGLHWSQDKSLAGHATCDTKTLHGAIFLREQSAAGREMGGTNLRSYLCFRVAEAVHSSPEPRGLSTACLASSITQQAIYSELIDRRRFALQ